MRKIPRTMATQHPDNAKFPEWSINGVIEGEGEVMEAFHCFNSLLIEEVMWDAEGKDVDTHVIRKLLSIYPDYFSQKIIGEDLFLTYRIPNPYIEGAEKKVFAETMESIPIAYDLAEKFYGKKVTPFFEVILPFTTSYRELISVLKYYEKVIVGRGEIELWDGIKVEQLIGETNPKSIEVIPLIEDKDSLIRINEIVKGYYKAIKPNYIRVFIARSDPAMNYGMIPAVLLSKLAIRKLYSISKELKIGIFPIIGVGSLPFRGNFNPENYNNVLDEYEGVFTFTVQSAFRYDYEEGDVKESIGKIKKREVREPISFSQEEEKTLVEMVNKYVKRYQVIIENIAHIINQVSSYLPKRRARKLHIGLFGYSRGIGNVKLPRAISFVGSLYSIGIPPELIGISSLEGFKEKEWDLLESSYKMLRKDLERSCKFANQANLDIIREIWKVKSEIVALIEKDMDFTSNTLGIKIGGDDYQSKKHELLSNLLLLSFRENQSDLRKYVEEMAIIRKSIG